MGKPGRLVIRFHSILRILITFDSVRTEKRVAIRNLNARYSRCGSWDLPNFAVNVPEP